MEKNTTWTLEALKEHFDVLLKYQFDDYNALLKERDERMIQRYASMELAVNKAETATEKRFEGVNEFRAQLGDQSRTLMPRIETEVLMKNMNDKIEALTTKVEKQENMKAGGSSMIAYIVAGISLVITVITLLSKFNIIK